MAEDKFATELTELINKHSEENGSNTPDFVLANYIRGCMDAFNEAVKSRDLFYTCGVHAPGGVIETIQDVENRYGR